MALTGHPNDVRSIPESRLDRLTGPARIRVLRCHEADGVAGRLRGADEGRRDHVPPLWLDSPVEPADLFWAWCGAGSPADGRIARALVERARAALGVGPPAGSAVERRWQIDAAAGGAGATDDPDAAAVARALVAADVGEPDDVAGTVRRGLDALPPGTADRFRRVARVWGAACRPIIVRCTGPEADWGPTIRWLVQAVEGSPEARLLVVADADAWARLEHMPDAHCLAVLRDGLAKADDLAADSSDKDGSTDEESAASRRRRAARGSNSRPSAAELAARYSLDALRARTARAVARAARAARRPEPAAPSRRTKRAMAAARSHAEALLYKALAADPRTAGRFALNAAGGFRFGRREAEIDLLCGSLGMAVEVDGHFHFQDTAAYRRDRRKDDLMQRHGLFVLRFLAEDVPGRLDGIVGRIAEVVVLREKQRGMTPPGRG